MHDVHAHLFHPKWYPQSFQDALLREFTRRQRAAGRPNAAAATRQLLKLMSDDTGVATIQIMDRAGIEKRAVLILDWGIELGEPATPIREMHREILGICRRFPDRLVGFAGVDPRRAEAIDLVRWAFDDLGAQGLKLHPTGGWKLSDPRTREVVGIAAERHMPVLVHVGKTVDILSDANAQPRAFLELAAAFPESAFIAGHSGFELWEDFVQRAPMVPSNVFFDVSGWQDRIRGDGANLRDDVRRLEATFPARVCFGSDSPFYSFNLILSEKQWVDRMADAITGSWAGFAELQAHGSAARAMQRC